MKNNLQHIVCSLNVGTNSSSTLIDESLRLAGLSKLFSVIGAFIRLSTLIFPMLVLLVFFNRSADADNSVLKLTTGAEYTSGDYGGTQAIDEWYIPFTARYIVDNYVFRLTVPFLSVTAPEGTIISSVTDGQVILPGTGERTTETSVGDVIAGMTYRDLLNSETSSDIALDLTAKVKLATADEDKGLGTGENDYTVQAELYKFFNRFTSYGILGYKFRGDPPGVDLQDSLLAIVGGYYRLSPSFKAGLDYYYQQASYSDLDDQKELSAFLGYKLSDSQYMRSYLIQGFGNGSPDWGAGVMITFTQ
jgi:hypothetical protein